MAVAIGHLVLLAVGLASAVSVSPPAEQISDLGSEELARLYGVPRPHVKGVPSLIKFQDPMPELLRRDCQGNGTNYCFGNNANYCANCGTCCPASSRYCCAADGVCCGSSCCGKGQTCNNGQCFQPPVTVTVASTVLQTVTKSRTQVNTVATTVLLTSTINSVIGLTITSVGATETNWQYVTVTTSLGNAARRSVPTAAAVAEGDGESASPDTIEALLELLDSEQLLAAEKRRLGARQEATKAPAAGAAATTTLETVVTQTKDVTAIITTEVASTQTSTVLKTVFQTKTKILSAQTTISPISTLTVTLYPPTTTYQTIVQTAIVDPTPNPTTTGPSLQTTPPAPSTGLSTPTVAGIGVGSAVFAIILALAIFFLVRHRRTAAARKQAIENACLGLHDDDAYVGPGYGHMSLPPPVAQASPTLPVVDGYSDGPMGAHKGSFTTTGSGAHHNSFTSTAASTTPHSATQAKFLNRPPAHHRSSSGFTGSTAVGGAGPKRASELSGRSVAGGTPPAELGRTSAEQQQQQPYLQELYDNEEHQYRESYQHHPAEMATDTGRYEVEGDGSPWYGGNVDGIEDHHAHAQQGSTHRRGSSPPVYRDF